MATEESMYGIMNFSSVFASNSWNKKATDIPSVLTTSTLIIEALKYRKSKELIHTLKH